MASDAWLQLGPCTLLKFPDAFVVQPHRVSAPRHQAVVFIVRHLRQVATVEPRVKGEVVDLNRGDAFRIVPFLTTIPCCHHHLGISKGSAVASHGPNELFEGESQRSTLQLSSRRRLHQQQRSRRAWRLQCEWNWSAQHKSCAVNSSWDPIPKIHSCWILRFGCPYTSTSRYPEHWWTLLVGFWFTWRDTNLSRH